jgi:uncharacterized membrane protein
MTALHFHLIINHFPIILPIAGAIILLVGVLIKSGQVKRTGYFVFMAGALFTLMAMRSGDGAEDIAEKINGISQLHIENHEENAETFALLNYLLGVLALVGLWASFKQKAFEGMLAVATLSFAVVVLFFARQTGTSGGEIRHVEIRENAVLPYQRVQQ